MPHKSVPQEIFSRKRYGERLRARLGQQWQAARTSGIEILRQPGVFLAHADGEIILTPLPCVLMSI